MKHRGARKSIEDLIVSELDSIQHTIGRMQLKLKRVDNKCRGWFGIGVKFNKSNIRSQYQLRQNIHESLYNVQSKKNFSFNFLCDEKFDRKKSKAIFFIKKAIIV